SRAKKFGNHQENKSLAQFFDSLAFLYPKFFLFENLEGLFNSYPEDQFRKKCKNYRLKIFKTSVSAFGNSQKDRKRLIVVGIRKDLPKKLKAKFVIKDHKTELKTC